MPQDSIDVKPRMPGLLLQKQLVWFEMIYFHSIINIGNLECAGSSCEIPPFGLNAAPSHSRLVPLVTLDFQGSWVDLLFSRGYCPVELLIFCPDIADQKGLINNQKFRRRKPGLVISQAIA